MAEVTNRADLIERKIDRELADEILVSREAGGVDIRKLGQVMEAAKLMSLSGSMVPAFLRENPGGCFGIVWKAYAWGMDPFAVASQAYEVENFRTKERTVAYMSQLTHAIIEARAPIKKRLAVRYEGEGDDRVCIVSGTFRNEDEPREHKSPRLGDRKPVPRKRTGRDGEEYETTSGSPLWQTKPDVQLFYDTSRDWARIYCPDVLLGIYTKEEMEEVGYVPPAPLPPPKPDDGGLATRLSASALARAGFPAEAAVAAVDAGLANRDNGGGALKGFPASVGVPEGAPSPSPEAAASSPSPDDTAEAPEPSDGQGATPAPENQESRPRPSRARRSGRPDDNEQRLV